MPYEYKEYLLNCSDEKFVLLHEILSLHGIKTNGVCSGRGSCGKCIVEVVGGVVSPLDPIERTSLSAEQLEKGCRLACYCKVKGQVKIKIPQAENNIKATGNNYLLENYKDSCLSLKSESNQAEVYYCDKLIAVKDNYENRSLYFAAVDIGTTAITVAVVDVLKNKQVSAKTAVNPQVEFGSDVMSRIQNAAQDNNALHRMSNLCIKTINDLIKQNCCATGIDSNDIYACSIAANSVMTHILFNVNPESLGKYPYLPVFKTQPEISAKKLNIDINHDGIVLCMPLISSYIGGDILAGIIATELYNQKSPGLLIDFGTNGEMVLANNKHLYACSAAMGPALEGMGIQCGMLAAAGAINTVKADKDGQILYTTIGDTMPRGLCGSGLLDLISLLVQKGIVNYRGRLSNENQVLKSESGSKELMTDIAGKRRFTIATNNDNQDIYVTQNDIRQVQMIKASVVSGIHILLDKVGLRPRDINKVYIAGGFGNSLNPESLIRLGFFPQDWLSKIEFAGNTSLIGASKCLLSRKIKNQTDYIYDKITCYQLSDNEDFNNIFIRQMYFKPQK